MARCFSPYYESRSQWRENIFKYGIKLEDINTITHEGKRMRGEFLVLLKDLGGLTYREVIEFDLFSDLSFGSLGSLYFHTKRRKKQWEKINTSKDRPLSQYSFIHYLKV